MIQCHTKRNIHDTENLVKSKDENTSCDVYTESGGNRTSQGVRRGGERRERIKGGNGMKDHVDRSRGNRDHHCRSFT